MTTPAPTDSTLRAAEDTAREALRTAVLADPVHRAWLDLAAARHNRQVLAGRAGAQPMPSPAPGLQEAVADILRAELLARR